MRRSDKVKTVYIRIATERRYIADARGIARGTERDQVERGRSAIAVSQHEMTV
jgi:hypothetical protein